MVVCNNCGMLFDIYGSCPKLRKIFWNLADETQVLAKIYDYVLILARR